MDTHLVQITDLVKDYAKIIDELRKENLELKNNSDSRCESLKNYYSETNRIALKNLELKKQNNVFNERITRQAETIINFDNKINNLEKENLELIKKTSDQSITINTFHKDRSFWKQREELKEENRILRQALSDIAVNLGNGSTVSVEASLPFIKELPHEVKLVCDGLRKELAREQRTCNTLREELMNPPPDVQEKVLGMLGVNKRLLELSEQYRELRDEVEYYLKEYPNYNGIRAFEKILKKHDNESTQTNNS